jgi:hypothetical protein
MKKIFYVLSISFLILQSCSSGDSNNSTNFDNTLLLGKWDLVSDKIGTANNPIEKITYCQQAFWQFDFKNNNELVFRSTSDDPSLTSGQCGPELLNYTYTINNEILTMTPVNSGYNGGNFKIKSLSSTQLVLRAGNDTDNTFRLFTFEK